MQISLCGSPFAFCKPVKFNVHMALFAANMSYVMRLISQNKISLEIEQKKSGKL